MSEEFIKFCEWFCFGRNTNFTICKESEYIDCSMFPKRILKEEYLVPVSVLLCLIFLFGLIGNLCVCVVIIRHPGMRTATNHYLFSLAVSDLLLILFGLPPELCYYWNTYPDIFGDVVCRLRTFISETTSYASVLTVIAFSIERYLAICHPLYTCSTGLKRATKVICGIWLVCFGCAVPQTLLSTAEGRVVYPPDLDQLSLLSTVCGPPTHVPSFLNTFLAVISVMFFFIPMAVLLFVYIRIGLCIRSRQKLRTVCGLQGRIHSDGAVVQNRTAIKVLVAVVITFFICWAPFHFQRIANTHLNHDAQRMVFVATGVLYYFSAAINPILYNVMSRRYRLAFKEALLGLRRESSSISQSVKLNGTFSLKNFTKGSSLRSKSDT